MRHARTLRLFSVASALSLALVACGGDSTAKEEPATTIAAATQPAVVDLPTEYGLVTPAQASQLADTDVTIIDVRTPEEFAEGHIDGATMIDFYSQTFADDIGALDKDGEYLVYCRSGSRSGQAVALMGSLGFEQVYDLDGGVLAYGAAGLPLVP